MMIAPQPSAAPDAVTAESLSRGAALAAPPPAAATSGARPRPGEAHLLTTPPANDDSIVAERLRRAAEQETDPQLRRKLWKEYRAYKKSLPAGS